MPTGTRKERIIKNNFELCKERAYRDHKKKYRTENIPLKVKKRLEREFTKAAYKADRISKGE